MPGKKLTPRQKKLAAMRAPKNKITRGDVIAAVKKPATKAKRVPNPRLKKSDIPKYKSGGPLKKSDIPKYKKPAAKKKK